MPARDLHHDVVRSALVKDGWTITDDPFVIEYEDVTLFADLGAERTLAAEREGRRIVVEIKTFAGPSPIREFETALGQYELYRGLLEVTEPDRVLYLAVADVVFDSLFQRESIQVIVRRNGLKFIVVGLENEEVLQWIE
jgi:hypothetical protein